MAQAHRRSCSCRGTVHRLILGRLSLSKFSARGFWESAMSVTRLFEIIASFMICSLLSGVCLGTERSDAVVDAVITGPDTQSAGIWRTKSQLVFDPAERTLIRRMYMVWDPMPERDLDFVWIPDSLRADKDGKVNGVGR